jgi:RimJ/RimL family protein N-acetyltransferase
MNRGSIASNAEIRPVAAARVAGGRSGAVCCPQRRPRRDGIHARGAYARGFGFWALELRATQALVGFTGLSLPRFEAPFTPCVEVGWRLARAFWGCGYASEAGHAALEFGFSTLDVDEIVAFTAESNLRSRAVMGLPRNGA